MPKLSALSLEIQARVMKRSRFLLFRLGATGQLLNAKYMARRYENNIKLSINLHWRWGGIGFHTSLSRNKAFPWNEALIERYADKWNWDDLSIDVSLPWSEALIERYQDKWNWHDLSGNKSLPWSESLIERYKDKWNWKGIYYEDNWEWLVHSTDLTLSKNESLPWSESLIERYADEWNWGWLSQNEGVIKLFNKWTKQEISTALERIGSAQNETDQY